MGGEPHLKYFTIKTANKKILKILDAFVTRPTIKALKFIELSSNFKKFDEMKMNSEVKGQTLLWTSGTKYS